MMGGAVFAVIILAAIVGLRGEEVRMRIGSMDYSVFLHTFVEGEPMHNMDHKKLTIPFVPGASGCIDRCRRHSGCTAVNYDWVYGSCSLLRAGRHPGDLGVSDRMYVHILILTHWRGSAWKAVWKELLVWLCLYYIVKVSLEYGLLAPQKETAKTIVRLFLGYTDSTPLQFLLGFYVGQILIRWWNQVQNVPWPDTLIRWMCFLLPDNDHDSNLRRHTVTRYLILSQVLMLRKVSSRIRKRFPTIQCVVASGLMTEREFEWYNTFPCRYSRWQLPLQWAVNHVMVPLTLRLDDPITVGTMGNMINDTIAYRENLRKLFLYYWIDIPLAYTQIVSVVVYGYFAVCCIGHQALGNDDIIYVPVLTIFQFVFYVGWIKVAQDLMRPFGEDDDDVPLNYLLDRHANVAFNLALHCPATRPALAEDARFLAMRATDRAACAVPYTKLSAQKSKDRPPTANKVTRGDVQMVHRKPADGRRAVLDGPPSSNDQNPRGAAAVKNGIRKLTRSNSEMAYF